MCQAIARMKQMRNNNCTPNVIKFFAFFICLSFQPCYGAEPEDMLSAANDALIFYGDGIGDSKKINVQLDKLSSSKIDSMVVLAQMLRTLTINPPKGELQWGFARKFSKHVRLAINNQEITKARPELILELMLTQYLAKSYLGLFEHAPENEGLIISMSDIELSELFQKSFSQNLDRKDKGTWRFVLHALTMANKDVLNAPSNYRHPLVVHRGVRSLRANLQ